MYTEAVYVHGSIICKMMQYMCMETVYVEEGNI